MVVFINRTILRQSGAIFKFSAVFERGIFKLSAIFEHSTAVFKCGVSASIKCNICASIKCGASHHYNSAIIKHSAVFKHNTIFKCNTA